MFGRVVKLQAGQDATRLLRGEGLIERTGGVGVEVVLHHADALGVWIALLDQVAQHLGVVLFSAVVSDRHMAPAGERFNHDEQVGGTVPLVLVVPTLDVPGCQG